MPGASNASDGHDCWTALVRAKSIGEVSSVVVVSPLTVIWLVCEVPIGPKVSVVGVSKST